MKLQHLEDKYLFGIVVFDYDDESKIDQSIESLNRINYDSKKYKIILSTKHNKKTAKLFEYIENFKKNNKLAEFILTLNEDADIETEAFLKCHKATFLIKINAGDQIDSDLLKDINTISYEEKFLSFEKDNIKVINCYTANNLYLDYNSFDKLFDALKDKETHKNLNEK